MDVCCYSCEKADDEDAVPDRKSSCGEYIYQTGLHIHNPQDVCLKLIQK